MTDLLGHEIDGIQELDNPPPPWLMGMLYLSIVFGIGYSIYYPSFWFWHGVSGWSSGGQYQTEMTQAKEQYAQFAPKEVNVVLDSANTTLCETGKTIFEAHCTACHGPGGSGKIGPSLVDAQWRYGGTDNDIFKSIRDGRPKGMPTWGKTLSSDEVTAVATYVRRLNGDALGGS